MKHLIPIWLAFVGCLIPAELAQEEAFVPASDVSFTISTDRTSYGRRQSIAVRYRIVNISNALVYVLRAWEEKCPARPHVWAWLENGAGKLFLQVMAVLAALFVGHTASPNVWRKKLFY